MQWSVGKELILLKPLPMIFIKALIIATLVEGVALGNEETAAKLSYASIAPSALFILCLTLDLLLDKHIYENVASNSKHKIVIYTNFDKDSKDHFTLLSKDRFKELQLAEEVNSEVTLRILPDK